MQDGNTGGFPFCNFSQAFMRFTSTWGFAGGAQDRQKVYSFLGRSVRVGFCSSDSSSFDELIIQADQSLFN